MSIKNSITGTLTDGLSSIAGNPKKALLILHKNSVAKIDSEDVAKTTEKALEAATGTEGLKKVFDLMNKSGQPFHVLQVQYNPSSIRFQANAESVPVQYLQQNVDSSIPNQNLRAPSVVLAVDLFFDAVNLKDSFITEKTRISANDLVSDAAALVQTIKGGYTVQPQTNGLIGMIMRESTRTVTFKWADMTFTGEATEASAKYTMFSVSGKPVRSIVTLNIAQKVSSKADLKYWDKAFDKCFGDMSSSASSGGKSIGDGVGNLLNITF